MLETLNSLADHMPSQAFWIDSQVFQGRSPFMVHARALARVKRHPRSNPIDVAVDTALMLLSLLGKLIELVTNRHRSSLATYGKPLLREMPIGTRVRQFKQGTIR